MGVCVCVRACMRVFVLFVTLALFRIANEICTIYLGGGAAAISRWREVDATGCNAGWGVLAAVVSPSSAGVLPNRLHAELGPVHLGCINALSISPSATVLNPGGGDNVDVDTNDNQLSPWGSASHADAVCFRSV